MTPLEQQVREALTDEVLDRVAKSEGRSDKVRDAIVAAIRPILAQHAQQAQQVRSKWHLEERAGCQVIVANDGSWCCPATDRELELIAQVQALTDDVADWMLVADGVKHDWRCQNDAVTGGMKGGTFICLRCQVEALTAERDRARRMVTCLRCIRTAHAGNGWGCARHRKEIATWPTK